MRVGQSDSLGEQVLPSRFRHHFLGPLRSSLDCKLFVATNTPAPPLDGGYHNSPAGLLTQVTDEAEGDLTLGSFGLRASRESDGVVDLPDRFGRRRFIAH